MGEDAVEPMQIDLVEDMNENNEDLSVSIQENDANFIVHNPNLDLESYASSYKDVGKILRLIHIADHCPSLKVDALKLAIKHVSTTLNVGMYQQLHKKLQDTTTQPNGQNSTSNGNEENSEAEAGTLLDRQWIEQTTRKSALTLDKLDTDLKNYKANSIKESIRRGYDDLGEFYLNCGDFANALKSFTRSRDYCTSPKHVVSMCLNVIKVSAYLTNWSHVTNFVMKAENVFDPTADEKKKSCKESSFNFGKIRCAAGLAELANKKYKNATQNFLNVNFESCDFPELISPNNVAVYVSLCALATFSRKELKEKIISSSQFKQFLELEPSIREVVMCFYDSKYGKCLQLLNDMKDTFMLDIYLAPHVKSLFSQIRSRGLVQYFSPYSSADISQMATCFNTTPSDLENELMNLILSGQIQARIDSHNKILNVRSVDGRTVTFEKALKMGRDYERNTKLMLLQTAMLKASVHVKLVGTSKEESTIQSNNRNSNV